VIAGGGGGKVNDTPLMRKRLKTMTSGGAGPAADDAESECRWSRQWRKAVLRCQGRR
jgi:hypothetical protein